MMKYICKPFFLLFIVVSVFLAGCQTVNLISDYDEETDKSVSALQKKVDTFFQMYESDPATIGGNYEQHISFYDEVQIDINSILFRVNAAPKNEISSELVTELDKIIDKFEELHQARLVDPEGLAEARKSVLNVFTNILTLELAKKKKESD